MTNIEAAKTKVRAATTGEVKMSSSYVLEAKRMSGFLLEKEFRGPGDTIEAAAYRLQSRFGIPVATTLRLRNREVRDMFMSSFVPVLNAYLSVRDKMNKAADYMEGKYHDERSMAADTALRRVADAVAGTETEKEVK